MEWHDVPEPLGGGLCRNRISLERPIVLWAHHKKESQVSRTALKRTQTKPAPVRVAGYVRQSVADNLEFGSLDAQAEAIRAFARSQRSEGWSLISQDYRDDGLSGGTLRRPGLERLLSDIENGLVDVVVVQRIDRLSRSLLDFAKLMDFFEKNDVAIVSVTQSFNSSNSMGQLTLNILMSFAQFERQMISERTADKMGATRKRGQWTGGRPVLGYDLTNKKLIVNPAETEQVRGIFRLYLDLGSLISVTQELGRRDN